RARPAPDRLCDRELPVRSAHGRRLVLDHGGDCAPGRGPAPRARHHRRIRRAHPARDAQTAKLHRGGNRGGSAPGRIARSLFRSANNDVHRSLQATALITLPTFAKISPIWSSLTISGGVSAMVSAVTRMTRFSSWNAFTIAS